MWLQFTGLQAVMLACLSGNHNDRYMVGDVLDR